MASPATPAPRTGARNPSSTSLDLRTGPSLVAGLLLVLVLLLRWMPGRADAARPRDAQAGVDPACDVRGGLTTVVPAPAADDLVQEQRGLRRSEVTVRERTMPGRRPAEPASSTQTPGTALLLAGVVELLVMVGPAPVVVRGITRPLRRVVGVLQDPAGGRTDRRPRLTTPGGVRDVCRALGTPVDGPAGRTGDGPDRRSTPRAPEERTATAVRTAATGIARQAHLPAPDAVVQGTPVRATVHAAARSRAWGPTTALWHAVQLSRPIGADEGACELAVCGSLVRVSAGECWPVATRDVCPTCAVLAH